MNALVPPKPRLAIEIVHDLVCPWCYLGVRRLLGTLRQRPDLLTELIWRPFLLNPDMPQGGMARAEYVARKFGGEDRARRLYASISDLGRAEGIDFRFHRIARMPSSINAHRLVRWSAHSGRADCVVEALFAAHFTKGRDIGDITVLGAIAASCGLDPAACRRMLVKDDGDDAVQANNLQAHRLGINGVPCFVIGGQHAIAGAQEQEVLDRLLNIEVAGMI